MSLATICSLCISCFALSVKSADIIPESIASEIFAKYPREITYVEDKYDAQIVRLTEENNELIKKEAATNYANSDYDFAGLMTELSLAKAQNSNRAVTQQVRLNETYSTYASYGPVGGKVIRKTATGLSETHSYTSAVTLKAGDKTSGITLSSGYTTLITYEFNGPSDDARMSNRMKPSHRLAVGMVLGTIIKYEYDMYDSWTGTGGHYVEYYIEDGSVTLYTFLAIIATPTYVDKASATSTIKFDNYQEFETVLLNRPNQIIV